MQKGPDKCLDVGCGFLKDSKRFNGIGIDLKRGLCDIVCDAQQLPFRNDVFSEFFLRAILEHLEDPIACLKEIQRTGKAKAKIHVLIPRDPNQNLHHLRLLIWRFPISIFHVVRYKLRLKKYPSMNHLSYIKPYHLSPFISFDKIKVITVRPEWFEEKKGIDRLKKFVAIYGPSVFVHYCINGNLT